jgi:hypothetical protein
MWKKNVMTRDAKSGEAEGSPAAAAYMEKN